MVAENVRHTLGRPQHGGSRVRNLFGASVAVTFLLLAACGSDKRSNSGSICTTPACTDDDNGYGEGNGSSGGNDGGGNDGGGNTGGNNGGGGTGGGGGGGGGT